MMVGSRRFFFVLVILILAGAVLGPGRVVAQEFECRVTLNYQKLQGSDYTYLDELRTEIEEYLNERRWTEDRFEEFERIDCTFQIFIEEAVSLTSFRARLIPAIRRPIFGTTQSTTVAQFNDAEWQFTYAQGTPLIYDPERFDPLTSMLDFYAFVLLGYDYDTFSELGGTPHFEKARRIAERAQSFGAAGWSQLSGDRGRTQLITQLLDPRFRPLRKAYFDYHFNGLDHFVSATDRARTATLSTLQELNILIQSLGRQYAIDLFFSAKFQELPFLFEGSALSSQAYGLLVELDPSHLSDYNMLVQ